MTPYLGSHLGPQSLGSHQHLADPYSYAQGVPSFGMAANVNMGCATPATVNESMLSALAAQFPIDTPQPDSSLLPEVEDAPTRLEEPPGSTDALDSDNVSTASTAACHEEHSCL